MKRNNRRHRLLTYLHIFRFKSLFVRYFLLLFLGLTLPVMALNFFYGNQMEQKMQERITELTNAQLNQRYELINAMLISARKIAYLLSEQSSLRYLNSLVTEVGADTSGNLKTLREIMTIFDQSFDYYHSIRIYLARSGTIITRYGTTSADSVQNCEWIHEFSPDMSHKPRLISSFRSDNYPHVITILYPVVTGKTVIGLVATEINVEELAKSFGTGKYNLSASDANMLILDQAVDMLLYSDEYNFLYQKDTDFSELRALAKTHPEGFSQKAAVWGRQYVISGRYDQRNELWYFLLMPLENFQILEQQTTRVLRICIVLSLVICLVQAAIQSMSVYQPIWKTLEIIRAQTGMLADASGSNEITEVQGFIRRTQDERAQLTETIARQLKELNKSQMYALQTQINPHFLYNTLEAIGNAEALEAGGANQISKAIFALGRMLRFSFTGDSLLVTVAEEMDHVGLYAKIMDFRYSGQIQVHFDIPAHVMSMQVVKLTLQPLIENAIVHGLNAHHYAGNIWVMCREVDGYLTIQVDDDGGGMDEESLSELREQVQLPVQPGMRHIGLRNVNQRMRLVFGEEYGLQIDRSPSGGLRVAMRFAAISTDNAQKDAILEEIAPLHDDIILSQEDI